jgi:hypothetical protein
MLAVKDMTIRRHMQARLFRVLLLSLAHYHSD